MRGGLNVANIFKLNQKKIDQELKGLTLFIIIFSKFVWNFSPHFLKRNFYLSQVTCQSRNMFSAIFYKHSIWNLCITTRHFALNVQNFRFTKYILLLWFHEYSPMIWVVITALMLCHYDNSAFMFSKSYATVLQFVYLWWISTYPY